MTSGLEVTLGRPSRSREGGGPSGRRASPPPLRPWTRWRRPAASDLPAGRSPGVRCRRPSRASSCSAFLLGEPGARRTTSRVLAASVSILPCRSTTVRGPGRFPFRWPSTAPEACRHRPVGQNVHHLCGARLAAGDVERRWASAERPSLHGRGRRLRRQNASPPGHHASDSRLLRQRSADLGGGHPRAGARGDGGARPQRGLASWCSSCRAAGGPARAHARQGGRRAVAKSKYKGRALPGRGRADDRGASPPGVAGRLARPTTAGHGRRCFGETVERLSTAGRSPPGRVPRPLRRACWRTWAMGAARRWQYRAATLAARAGPPPPGPCCMVPVVQRLANARQPDTNSDWASSTMGTLGALARACCRASG